MNALVPNRIRVVLADDSSFVRKVFARVLGKEADIEVVGEASDGAEAFELCRRLTPDVMLLDLQMPVRDGLSTLEALRHLRCPTRVVVVSASTQRGAEVTLNALEKGAFDFIDKAARSTMQLHELGSELLEKVRSAGLRRDGAPVAKASPALDPRAAAPEVLVVGASTGGPLALAALLAGLPSDFNVPVVVVQHIPASYVPPLASRLSRAATRPAEPVRPGQKLEAGKIYLAFGKHESELYRTEGSLAVVWRRADPGTPHVPSVDSLFHSAARVCGPRAWGALLTGMGRDGAEGLLAIRNAGGFTVAQDEATSAVWGMPKVACELGAAYAVLAIHALGPFLGEQHRSVVQPGSEVRPIRKEAPCAQR